MWQSGVVRFDLFGRPLQRKMAGLKCVSAVGLSLWLVVLWTLLCWLGLVMVR